MTQQCEPTLRFGDEEMTFEEFMEEPANAGFMFELIDKTARKASREEIEEEVCDGHREWTETSRSTSTVTLESGSCEVDVERINSISFANTCGGTMTLTFTGW